MKNIFIIPLSLFVILTLAACSQNTSPSKSPQVQPDAGKDAALGKEVKAAREETWETTLRAAKKEGKVVVYASTGAANFRDTLIKKMKEKFSLEAEMTIGRGNEISQKIFSERNASLYLADVYLGGPTTIITVFVPAGVFDPIEKVLILPEVYEAKYWQGNKLPYLESGKYALRMDAGVNAPLAINTGLVRPEEMTSYMDLLNPKWKNKIVMNDPSVAGSGQSFFYFVGIRMMGLEFMRQLAKQEPIILRDARLLADWLAKGKYPIAIGPLPDPVLQYKNEGAPVMLIGYMKEGGLISPSAGHMALMNKAPHPNSAAVFINWLLSRDGQISWSKVQNYHSRRIDVPAEGIEPFRIPDPSKRYFEEDE